MSAEKLPKPVLKLGEETTPRVPENKIAEKAIAGKDKKIARATRKQSVVLQQEVAKLGKHLSKETRRAPDVWSNVVARVEVFENHFKSELDRLVEELKAHTIRSESEIDETNYQLLIKSLSAVRNYAGRAFNERLRYVDQKERTTIKKVKIFRNEIPYGMSLVKEANIHAFSRVAPLTEEDEKMLREQRLNQRPDAELKESVGAAIEDLNMRFTEFLAIGDRLPKKENLGAIVAQFEKEHDHLMRAISVIDTFLERLEREEVRTVGDYAKIVNELPEGMEKKIRTEFDFKLTQRLIKHKTLKINGEIHDDYTGNPKRQIQDHERQALMAHAEELQGRLVKLAQTYEEVLKQCKNIKI